MATDDRDERPTATPPAGAPGDAPAPGAADGPAAADGPVAAVPAGAAGGAAGRSRPAHLAHPPARAERIRRRRAVVLAGMGALTVVGVGLTVTGLSRVRSSTVGRYEEVVGADEPGHQAYVVPTPTMGVLHRGADGTLAGVYLLALEPADEGGTVVAVPPATVVPGGDRTLADVFRDEGAEAAAESLGLVVTVGVAEHVEVDDDRWAGLVEPMAPVEVTIDRPIGRWAAGDVTLAPGDVGPFLSARGDDETDLARLERQEAFWSAWLPRVEGGGEDALPGEVSSGIGRFVRGIANAGQVAGLPVAGREGGDGLLRFVPDGSLLGRLVSQAVPFPRSPAPGARVRVRLLSGTGDPDQAAAAARALVAGGAEIVIVGNASEFDVAETTLIHAPDVGDRARWLQALAIDGRLEEAEGAAPDVAPDGEIDVTVILGHDAEDLMRR